MVIVRLRGGLGNQMFQYALGKRISEQLNTPLKLDLTTILRVKKKEGFTYRPYQLHIFNVEESYLINPKTIRFFNKLHLHFIVEIIKGIKLLGKKKVKEKTFTVDDNLINSPLNNALYSGYWQSEKYFSDAEASLRLDFSFKESLSPQATNILEKIQQTNSVCVHMRRGDYVQNNYFVPMSSDYFEKASTYINDHIKDPHFFIFSDEPQWCIDNIKMDANFTVVDFETEKIKYKEDLQLMASCQHFIMSASSFSWWAVWLSGVKNKITIAPKQWFADQSIDVSDLVGSDWIRL
ncbi:alpha-1,2-fucosyltransferase [Corallibacter vietnamensis]|uniref:Alpha-1,2-fucosyltransferase n=1 Tax=Corallibacter vietnamensis TaxID=904130 RepID=A0ABP7H2H8_9FLAO